MQIKILLGLAIAAGLGLGSANVGAAPTIPPDGRNLPPAGPGIPYPHGSDWWHSYFDNFPGVGWLPCTVQVQPTSRTKSGHIDPRYRRFDLTTNCPSFLMVY